ncbi:MAG: tetratricopeptide repeat protein, partial [Rhodanobacteraceae bacterium]
AHTAMEGVERFLYHNIAAARDQDQQAVDLRPNDADALTDLAIEDENLGDVNGYRFMERAVALEPANSRLEYHLALDRTFRGDYGGARRAATRALAIDPHSARTYALLSRIDVLQGGDVEAAAKVLGGMPPGTPSNSLVIAEARINLLLYRRDFAGARTLAAKYAVEFANTPAALDIFMSQANIEWLAGKKDASRGFYHHAIQLLTKPGRTNTGGDMRLGLAYARLGHAAAAMKQNEMSVARNRRSHGMGFEGQRKFMFAKIQLALGQRAAAIGTLAGLLTPNVNPYVDADHYSLSPAMLRIDPTWDPLRGNPQFQALLTKVSTPRAAASTGGP